MSDGGGRERILAAAVDRIASDGIDEVRIARIAMDAGVSTALVHYHFATREALLGEALEYSFEHAGDLRMGEEEQLDEAAETHAERIASMVEQCLPSSATRERDWVLWVELWLRAVRHPELRPTAERLYARMRKWFAMAIADGIEAGEFKDCDPEAVADRALALIDGFGVRALLGDSEVPLDRARREIGSVLAADLGIGDRLPFPSSVGSS
ncbi:MAG TPA: TetR/AcrR family transcriptional regulator [Thermoleophilaceae bacterium]|jgi:AcrR family transcriptional regulator